MIARLLAWKAWQLEYWPHRSGWRCFRDFWDDNEGLFRQEAAGLMFWRRR